MAVRFSPCPACARHVREGDAKCPFCGAEPFHPPQAPLVARGRLSRAALIAAGAAGALAATDCSSSSTQAIYGAPIAPLDAGTSANDAGGEGQGTEAGFAEPLYGAMAPPLEASVPEGDATADAGGGVGADAAGGGVDAASEAGGAVGEAGMEGGGFAQPLYGAVAPH
jgi:hypothetical protein